MSNLLKMGSRAIVTWIDNETIICRKKSIYVNISLKRFYVFIRNFWWFETKLFLKLFIYLVRSSLISVENFQWLLWWLSTNNQSPYRDHPLQPCWLLSLVQERLSACSLNTSSRLPYCPRAYANTLFHAWNSLGYPHGSLPSLPSSLCSNVTL